MSRTFKFKFYDKDGYIGTDTFHCDNVFQLAENYYVNICGLSIAEIKSIKINVFEKTIICKNIVGEKFFCVYD